MTTSKPTPKLKQVSSVDQLHDPDITPAIAAGVLAYFQRGGGVTAPLFYRRLLLAIQDGSPEQRAQLAIAFPGWVKAFELGQQRGGGASRLIRIAKSSAGRA